MVSGMVRYTIAALTIVRDFKTKINLSLHFAYMVKYVVVVNSVEGYTWHQKGRCGSHFHDLQTQDMSARIHVKIASVE